MPRSPEDSFSGLIDLWSVADVEVRFAGNGDDRCFVDRQLFRRSDVKRKSRPTKNRVASWRMNLG